MTIQKEKSRSVIGALYSHDSVTSSKQNSRSDNPTTIAQTMHPAPQTITLLFQ